MDMSPTGEMCYTGGYDGTICCWAVPSTGIEVYANYSNKIFFKFYLFDVWLNSLLV